jgi:hypothetical protein
MSLSSPAGNLRAAMLAAHRRALALRSVPPALRGAALMPAAALGVHQLRYELAFGAQAPHALAAQGHAYLASLAPWIVLLATLAFGAALGGLARRWTSAAAATPGRPRHAGLRVWCSGTLALIAVYAAQELLEGLLASGHPGGLHGVFGHGGWWAVPAAVAIAGLLSLALRVGQLVEQAIDDVKPFAPRAVAAAVRPLRLAVAPFIASPGPLAHAAGGRGPPHAGT